MLLLVEKPRYIDEDSLYMYYLYCEYDMYLARVLYNLYKNYLKAGFLGDEEEQSYIRWRVENLIKNLSDEAISEISFAFDME